MTLHGCVVAGCARAVLIMGAPGAGKSVLALHLVARGADLVADDRVVLQARGDALIASAPAPLSGLIELRGVGIGRVVPRSFAAISLVVDLDIAPDGRQPGPLAWTYEGITLRRIAGQGVRVLPPLLELWLRGDLDIDREDGAVHD